MRLVLTADTHVPKRARDLPGPLWAAVEAADVVVHAGDWVDEALLDAMTARSRRLIGVYGNNDGPALRARLPEVARVELDGLRVAVVHETGPEDRPGEAVRGPLPRRRRAGVRAFAHPLGHRGPGGLRLLNPGSPTDRRSQPHATYLTAEVHAGALTKVHLHRLPAPAPARPAASPRRSCTYCRRLAPVSILSRQKSRSAEVTGLGPSRPGVRRSAWTPRPWSGRPGARRGPPGPACSGRTPGRRSAARPR